MTNRDRKMAVRLLSSISDRKDRDAEETKQIKELQIMLMIGVKAEIQAVDNRGDITDWLDERLSSSLGADIEL